MICTIMQPAYLPWLGYFERIAMSDVFVVLDHVDIDRNSQTKFANRNKIRTANGWQWLTMPIVTKGVDSLKLCDLRIQNNQPWRQKHLASIRHSYSKAPYYKQYIGFFEDLFKEDWQQLAPICNRMLEWTIQELGIQTKLVWSSEMELTTQKDELIIEICQKMQANRYISGPFGRDYLDAETFEDAEIELAFHDYVHPEYSQTYPGFEAYMATIDLLFNHGPKSLSILHTQST